MMRTTALLSFAALALWVAGRDAVTFRHAAAEPPEKTPAELPDTPGKDAEPLPPVPKAEPDSQVKPLLPNGGLYLETRPGDRGRRVLVAAEVCLRQGPLEVFLCKARTKEHEAVVRTDVDAQMIHAALLAAGARQGAPVQFMNPKTREAEYKAATGSKVRVLVHYRKGGQLHTHPAQEWVWNHKAKKAMDHEWVFAGSRLVPNPDRPKDPPFYAANGGDIVGISNSPEATLDLPVEVSRDDNELSFEAKTDRIPPLLSKVWLVFEPVREKK